MLNLVSLLLGLVALLAGLIAFVPLLGWAYWFIIPVAIVGLAIGLLSSGKAGRNINLLVIVIGIVRLTIGHGLF